jgi:hypothetical protein
MYSDAAQQSAKFGLGQQSAILGALGGGNLANALGDLSAQGYNRQRLNDSERDAMLAALAKLGIENAPAILKALGVGG